MFPSAAEILKSPEGSLEQTPLPLLLHSVLREQRTGALELTLRQLEKKILFEDGVPVGCTTNLLHETLGKFLVEKGKLSEADYQQSLAESVQTGSSVEDVLVRKGLIPPFELYKQMQANLGHTILDCFRWADARYRWNWEIPSVSSPVRVNAVQLILTGTNAALPFDVVATHLSFVDEQCFGLVTPPPHDPSELKLSTKDMKLLQVLRAKPTFAEMTAKTGLETEPLLRRLYALAVLGFVDFTEREAAAAAPAAVAAAPAPTPAAVTVATLAAVAVAAPAAAESARSFYLDGDPGRCNALVQAFMSIRSKDPFELLGVPENVPILGIRQAFLERADAFSPVRFQDPDLHEKAEALLLAFARAFAELSNPEQLGFWRRRRQVTPEKASLERRPHAPRVEIKSELLDAAQQVEEGKAALAANDAKRALGLFSYACEMEPKGLYVTYRGWARYCLNPTLHRKLAIQEMRQALELDPACDLAYFFLGEIHRQGGELADAEAAYRRAFKMNPQQRKYAELIKAMIQEQKDRANVR